MAETKRVRTPRANKTKIFKQEKIESRYKMDEYDAFKETLGPQSLGELVRKLHESKDTEIQAKVITVNKQGAVKPAYLNKKAFLEAHKTNEQLSPFKLREGAFKEQSIDWFGTDAEPSVNTIGKDYIPLLGGPFNRQQYLNAMLQGHQQAFFAFHHDPIAREAINIIRHFVLGRGWRVDCENAAALAIWRAFEEANDMNQLVEWMCVELALYGEIFLRWLPPDGAGYQAYLAYKVDPKQKPPATVLPRVRLADPSTCWEIITYPEDMKRVLAYTFVYPTQYSMYTASDKGAPVPATKYIYEQVKPNEIDHFKINTVSNEKRGRSDLYPVFGYLKRLRDSVNYSIIGMQKATAWSIDTVVDGNQTDIDNYISEMNGLGTIPNPGSEFVHSKKIERKYLANEGSSRGGQSQAFDWCLSMICAGLGIPVNYFGTHLSTSGTRASSIVATEPVAKKFEARQLVIERIIKSMAKRVFKQFDIDEEIEVTFPDIVTQDRSAKLKDLALCQSQSWISEERAAEIASKELGVTDFDYDLEKKVIEQEAAGAPNDMNPLGTRETLDKDGKPIAGAAAGAQHPSMGNQPQPPQFGGNQNQLDNQQDKSINARKSGIDSSEKRSIKMGRGM